MASRGLGRRITAVLAAGCTTALVVVACGSNQSGTPNAAPVGTTLNLSFLQDPGQPPDPDVFYGTQGLLLTTNVYEGLLTFESGTATPKLAPALATSWTESPDHTVFALQLRQGVKFHDGSPFTADAVKASFDRRTAVDQGPAYMVKDVDSIQTQGDYAVTITLKAPDSSFLYELASPYGPKMLSPTALAANAGTDHAQSYLTTHDIGTGPYVLSEAKVGDKYQLTAFPDYWGKKPYYTTVELPVVADTSSQQLQLDSGALAAILHDIPSSAVATYQANPKFTSYSLPTTMSDYMYVNPKTPAMSSLELRTALLQAVDIDALAANAYFGRGRAAKQIYPANINDPKYAAQNIVHDPAKLKAAVAALPAASRSVVIAHDSSSPDNQQVAELLVTQLGQAGLTATVQSVPAAQMFNWITDPTGAPDILVNLGLPDAPTPYLWEHINFDPGGGVNYFGCSSPTATDYIAKGRATGSAEDLSKGAEAAQATGCWLNLVDVDDFMVAQPWLKGVERAHLVSVPTSLALNELYQ